MIENSVQFLETYVLPLGPLGVFLASVVEEVVAPIPSAIVMMTSGFLFLTGPVDFSNIMELVLLVAVPASIGVTLGSLLIYGLSWWGGKRVIDSWGRYMGFSWADIEKLDERMKSTKKDELAVIIARTIPAVPTVAVSAFCGLVHMNIWKYVKLTFVGSMLRSLILATIGWQVGNVYYRYAEAIARFEKLGLILIGSVILACVVWLYLRKYLKIRSKYE